MHYRHVPPLASPALAVAGVFMVVFGVHAQWQEPQQTPPAGNPPGFVWLQGATPSVQSGTINISGVASFGQLITSQNGVGSNAFGDPNAVTGVVVSNATVRETRVGVSTDVGAVFRIDSQYRTVTGALQPSFVEIGTRSGAFTNVRTDRASGFLMENPLWVWPGYISILTSTAPGAEYGQLQSYGNLRLQTINVASEANEIRIEIDDATGNVGIGGEPDALHRVLVQGKLNADELCIAGVCQTTWPSGGGGTNVQLQGTTPGTAQSGNFNVSGTGNVGTLTVGNTQGSLTLAPALIGTTPVAQLSVSDPFTIPVAIAADVKTNGNCNAQNDCYGAFGTMAGDLRLTTGDAVRIDVSGLSGVVGIGGSYASRTYAGGPDQLQVGQDIAFGLDAPFFGANPADTYAELNAPVENFYMNSSGNIQIRLDTDQPNGDGVVKRFTIVNGANTTMFSVSESGIATTGSIDLVGIGSVQPQATIHALANTFNINGDGNVQVQLDADNNSPQDAFVVMDGAGTTLLTVVETGVVSALLGVRSPSISATGATGDVSAGRDVSASRDVVATQDVRAGGDFTTLFGAVNAGQFCLSSSCITSWPSSGGGGSVTSVGLAMPAQFTVTGSPITSSGTLTAAWAAQNANAVLAGPASGAAAAPTFRALVAADIPSLDAAQITSGTLTDLRLPTVISQATTFTGAPAGSGVLQGPLMVNPLAAGVASNETLFGIAVGGSARLRVDDDGDLFHDNESSPFNIQSAQDAIVRLDGNNTTGAVNAFIVRSGSPVSNEDVFRVAENGTMRLWAPSLAANATIFNIVHGAGASTSKFSVDSDGDATIPGSATVSGALTAGSATVSGALTAGSATVTGALTAGGQSVLRGWRYAGGSVLTKDNNPAGDPDPPTSHEISCASGEIVITGGCLITDGVLRGSRPVSTATWECIANSTGANTTVAVYVICAQP